jgi:hypothetical protein
MRGDFPVCPIEDAFVFALGLKPMNAALKGTHGKK